MKLQIAAILLSPAIFSLFSLALSSIFSYLISVIKTNQRQNQMNKLAELIEKTAGRFYTIKFQKKDGTIRTINAKNKYFRLIKGTGSPATDALKEQGFLNSVNRNKETWFSFKPELVKEFKCGEIHEIF